MSHWAEVGLGIGLAGACGLRIFVPLTLLSLAAWSGHLKLLPSLDWIGSTPALVIFAVACAVEIAAYYLPWIDNLLDWLATPAALAAGVVSSAAVMDGMSPAARWSIALIAGGGVAGLFQGSTVLARKASSGLTLGLGNWILATAELVLSILTVVVAFLAPILILGVVLLVGGWTLWRRTRTPATA